MNDMIYNHELFLCSPKQRLQNWKALRRSLSDQTEVEQLKSVAEYWACAPLVLQNIIDPDSPDTWLTPWEVLHNGDFCRNTVAYMMEQTLIQRTDGWSPDRLELWEVKNLDYSEWHFILVVDGKYMLNYDLGQVIDIDDISENTIITNKYRAATDGHRDMMAH